MLGVTVARRPTGSAAPKLILTVSSSEGLGDGIVLLPFLRRLRQIAPSARIVHAVSGPTTLAGPLRRFCTGLIDEIRPDLRLFPGPWPSLAALRTLPEADLAFLLVTRWTWLAAARVTVPATRIVSELPGYVWSDGKPSPRRRPARKWMRTLRLVEAAFGVPAPPPARPLLEPLGDAVAWALNELPPGSHYAGLYVGARPDRRALPVATAVDLAGALVARGMVPVVLAGPHELASLGELKTALPDARFPGTDDGGFPDVEQVLGLAGRLDLAVVKDGGLSHVLGGAGTPLVHLVIRLRPWWNLEPSSPQKWLPCGDEVRMLWLGRHARRVSLPRVLAEIDSLLGSPAVAARRQRLSAG